MECSTLETHANLLIRAVASQPQIKLAITENPCVGCKCHQQRSCLRTNTRADSNEKTSIISVDANHKTETLSELFGQFFKGALKQSSALLYNGFRSLDFAIRTEI